MRALIFIFAYRSSQKQPKGVPPPQNGAQVIGAGGGAGGVGGAGGDGGIARHCSNTGESTPGSALLACAANSRTHQLDGIRAAIIERCAEVVAEAQAGEPPAKAFAARNRSKGAAGRSKGAGDRAASRLQRGPRQPSPLGDLKDGATERDLQHRPRPGRMRAGCGGGPLLAAWCRDVLDAPGGGLERQ